MLSLALGLGSYAPVMAMAMPDDMDMSASHDQMSCCPSSDTTPDDVKANMCAAMCAAMTQAALPMPMTTFIPSVTNLTYVHADHLSRDHFLSPDSPPPKA